MADWRFEQEMIEDPSFAQKQFPKYGYKDKHRG
jgi:hypothetical protein